MEPEKQRRCSQSIRQIPASVLQSTKGGAGFSPILIATFVIPSRTLHTICWCLPFEITIGSTLAPAAVWDTTTKGPFGPWCIVQHPQDPTAPSAITVLRAGSHHLLGEDMFPSYLDVSPGRSLRIFSKDPPVLRFASSGSFSMTAALKPARTARSRYWRASAGLAERFATTAALNRSSGGSGPEASDFRR